MVDLRLTSLLPHHGGIVTYQDPDLALDVSVRVREADDGRWEITEIYVGAEDRPISAEDLRRIPLGRIEAFANDPFVAEELRLGITDTRVSLEETARKATAASAEAQRELALLSSARRPPRVRLAVPKQRPYPDAFYERIAGLYADLAARGSRPSAVIAETNTLPITTVHRWVKECRQRGLLPPGRAGKAG